MIFLCLICACFVAPAYSQEPDQRQKPKYVVVPPEQVFLTIAYQPGCPLEFEEVKYLASLDGGGTPSFLVRNTGSKPIRSFTVGTPGWTVTWSADYTKKLLPPGERVAPSGGGEVEVMPLSNELREKLQLKGPMRDLIVLMVVRVEYADGTVFGDETTYEALIKFVDKIIDLKSVSKAK